MEIKTKFNIGDTIWFLRANQVTSAEVKSIATDTTVSTTARSAPVCQNCRADLQITKVTYNVYFERTGWVQQDEDFAFGSKEELLKSL